MRLGSTTLAVHSFYIVLDLITSTFFIHIPSPSLPALPFIMAKYSIPSSIFSAPAFAAPGFHARSPGCHSSISLSWPRTPSREISMQLLRFVSVLFSSPLAIVPPRYISAIVATPPQSSGIHVHGDGASPSRIRCSAIAPGGHRPVRAFPFVFSAPPAGFRRDRTARLMSALMPSGDARPGQAGDEFPPAGNAFEFILAARAGSWNVGTRIPAVIPPFQALAGHQASAVISRPDFLKLRIEVGGLALTSRSVIWVLRCH